MDFCNPVRCYCVSRATSQFSRASENYLESVVQGMHSHSFSLVALEPPQVPFSRGNSTFSPPRRRWSSTISSLRLFRASLAAAAVAFLTHLINGFRNKRQIRFQPRIATLLITFLIPPSSQNYLKTLLRGGVRRQFDCWHTGASSKIVMHLRPSLEISQKEKWNQRKRPIAIPYVTSVYKRLLATDFYRTENSK